MSVLFVLGLTSRDTRKRLRTAGRGALLAPRQASRLAIDRLAVTKDRRTPAAPPRVFDTTFDSSRAEQ